MPRRTLDTDKLVAAISKSRKQGAKTKVQLASKFGFSYNVVSNAVNALVAEGTVEAVGKVETGKQGRPHILYRAA